MMARIQVSNDPSGRIIVSFPYDPLLVEKVNPAVALERQLGVPPMLYPAVHNCWVKIIDGRRWHPAEKHWSFLRLDVGTKSLGKILSPLDTLELPKGGDA